MLVSASCGSSVHEGSGGSGGGGNGPTTLRPNGEACAFDDQCLNGRCSADGDGCGTCLDVHLLGESCGGAGVTCTRTAVCRHGVCASTKMTEGEPCHSDSLHDSQDCDAQFFCDAPADTDGVCRALPAVGEPCSGNPTRECFAPAHCENDICQRPSSGGLDESCFSVECAAGLACHRSLGSYICEPSKSIPEGGTCGDDSLDDCIAGTTCDWVDIGHSDAMTCQVGLGEGKDCTRHACADKLTCFASDAVPTCVPLGREGDSCAHGFCLDGFECRGDVCRAPCD